MEEQITLANPITTIKVGSTTYECKDATVASLASQVQSKITDLTNRSSGYMTGQVASFSINYDVNTGDNAKYVYHDATVWMNNADSAISTGNSYYTQFRNVYNTINDTNHQASIAWSQSFAGASIPMMLHSSVSNVNNNYIGGWDNALVLYRILNYGKNSVQFYLEGSGQVFELAAVSIPTSAQPGNNYALLFTDTIYYGSSSSFTGDQYFIMIEDTIPNSLPKFLTGSQWTAGSANNNAYAYVTSSSYGYQSFS